MFTTIRMPEVPRVCVAKATARAAFDAEADERFARIAASGETVSWQEMRAYLQARLAGKAVERPQAR